MNIFGTKFYSTDFEVVTYDAKENRLRVFFLFNQYLSNLKRPSCAVHSSASKIHAEKVVVIGQSLIKFGDNHEIFLRVLGEDSSDCYCINFFFRFYFGGAL